MADLNCNYLCFGRGCLLFVELSLIFKTEINLNVMETFVETALSVADIEIVPDFAIEDGKKYFVVENVIGVSDSFLKEMIKFISENIFNDEILCSKIGMIIGSYDERCYFVNKEKKLYDYKIEYKCLLLGIKCSPKSSLSYSRLKEIVSEYKSEKMVKEVLETLNIVVKRRDRNYVLWSFRTWLFDNFKHFNLIDDELKWIQNWCYQNPRDYSAFSYHQHIMPLTRDYLLKELQNNTYNILLSPGSESLWYHRRFLITKLKDMIDFSSKIFDADAIDISCSDYDFDVVHELYCKLSLKYKVKLPFIHDVIDEADIDRLVIDNDLLLLEISIKEKNIISYLSQYNCALGYHRWLMLLKKKLNKQ